MNERIIVCPMCNGAERLRQTEGEGPDSYDTPVVCWYCEGSGRVTERTTHEPYKPAKAIIILRNRNNPKFN